MLFRDISLFQAKCDLSRKGVDYWSRSEDQFVLVNPMDEIVALEQMKSSLAVQQFFKTDQNLLQSSLFGIPRICFK